jgi:hypothetical protein
VSNDILKNINRNIFTGFTFFFKSSALPNWLRFTLLLSKAQNGSIGFSSGEYEGR